MYYSCVGHEAYACPEGNNICHKPWWNVPDDIDSDYDFVNKVGIMCLEKGEYKKYIQLLTKSRKIKNAYKRTLLKI